MPLIPCKSCNHSIDSGAKTCPQCGATNQAAYAGVRFAGLIYLALIGALFYWVWGLMTPEPRSTTAIGYTITKDDYSPGRPRKVEVTLPRRLNETELAEVAQAVRDDTDLSVDRTFIGFRVEGQNSEYYWANASFDPGYEHSLIGLSVDDYQALAALPLDSYTGVIGSWLDDGAPGHVKVLYANDDGHFIDSVFVGGGVNTETYVASKLPDGSLRLEEPEAESGEHYIVTTDGALQGWSENGNYQTLPPRKPVP